MQVVSAINRMYCQCKVEEEMMSSRDPGHNARQPFGAIVRFYREKVGISRAKLATAGNVWLARPDSNRRDAV